jgi:hypothetical protein
MCRNLYSTINFERHPELLKLTISFMKIISRQLLKLIYLSTTVLVSFESLAKVICVSCSLLCVIIQEGNCSLRSGDILSGALATTVHTEYLQDTGI